MSADTIAAAVQTVERGFSSFRSDLRAIDEPLQFCLNGSPSLDYHALPRFRLDLTVGFLFTDGIMTTCARFCRCAPNPLTIPPETQAIG